MNILGHFEEMCDPNIVSETRDKCSALIAGSVSDEERKCCNIGARSRKLTLLWLKSIACSPSIER